MRGAPATHSPFVFLCLGLLLDEVIMIITKLPLYINDNCNQNKAGLCNTYDREEGHLTLSLSRFLFFFFFFLSLPLSSISPNQIENFEPAALGLICKYPYNKNATQPNSPDSNLAKQLLCADTDVQEFCSFQIGTTVMP